MISASASKHESNQRAPARTLLKARWVLPITAPALPFGALELSGDRIKAVLSAEQAQQRLQADDGSLTVRDLGNCIIAPGLINLHTHLEWTAQELRDSSSSLFDWIPGLMKESKGWAAEDFLSSSVQGVRRIIASGTSCVLDSAYSGAAAQALSAAGLRAVVALELFGLDESKSKEILAAWCQKRATLLESGKISPRVSLSIAPHAPYSVSVPLAKAAFSFAEEHGVPPTMHLAESQVESDWLQSGSAKLDAFLERAHRLPEGAAKLIPFRACGRSPVQHLQHHSLLTSSLVAAHVVHLHSDDVKMLAAANVKVACCPRSNSRLRNGVAPLRKLMEAGLTLGFGTDSAASTDDLDVLCEARFAYNLQRAVDPSFPFSSENALRQLTYDAARVLGMEKQIGSLEPGKLADIAIFNIASAGRFAENQPYDALLYGRTTLKELLVSGMKVGPEPLY
jgi:5-methylthioadenosine/S-adenosylhomocysteine deaminase